METGLSKRKSGASKQINLGTSTQPESETRKELTTPDVSVEASSHLYIMTYVPDDYQDDDT